MIYHTRLRAALLVLVVYPCAASMAAPSEEYETITEKATTIKSVRLNPAGDAAELIVFADGVMEYRLSYQKGSLELVLDILDVRNPVKATTASRTHSLVKLIRTEELPMKGTGSTADGRTMGRITLELKQPIQHRIRDQETQLKLELTPLDGGPLTSKASPADGQTVAPAEAIPHLVTPSDFNIKPEDVDPSLFFGSAPVDSDRHELGPEDILEVKAFELDHFNRTVRVSGDGTIDLPLVGSVHVQGLVAEQAAARIAGQLREEYVQNPQISVFVKEFNSRKLSLLGAVRKPATYTILGRRSLLQLLAEAGGVTADADRVLYVLRQTEDGRRARLLVPLSALLVEGDPRWDIWLRPGDVVSVPPTETISVSVLGAVSEPGIYELREDHASLLNAIAVAGGLNRRAAKKSIDVQRTGSDTILKVNLADILSGAKPDFSLKDGDVVFVNEKFF